ncbi:PAS domain-containing sensor histidine kinase [Methylophaga sp. 41_12_T18]|nr:PAS domain-containing sensor histidine kinase [Methylophaga sp. 41_12_T18]
MSLNLSDLRSASQEAKLSALHGEGLSAHDWQQFDSSKLQLHTVLRQSQHEQAAQAVTATSIANRMTSLLAVLPAGVVVLDGTGHVLECNAAAISLLGEPLEGEKWTEVIGRAFQPKLNDGHDVSLKDGRLVHILTSPLDGEPGQIILLNDVTETRQLQNKVSHLQRLSAMGEMAARLAHQMRTPLSSALLYLAPLLKPETDKALQHRFAKRLHASITHMERLIKDMLAFSRGDMAATSPVEIDTLLAAIEQQFSAQVDAENFNLEIHNSTDNAYVYGSKEALASALNNLLDNARLACGSNGEITVYAELVQDEAGNDCIEISVEDNGVGISEADKDQILQPFFTTRSSGTGLGLAVVQSIVKAHKGMLWLESEQGDGSTFSIRLPMYQSASQFELKAQQS